MASKTIRLKFGLAVSASQQTLAADLGDLQARIYSDPKFKVSIPCSIDSQSIAAAVSNLEKGLTQSGTKLDLGKMIKNSDKSTTSNLSDAAFKSLQGSLSAVDTSLQNLTAAINSLNGSPANSAKNNASVSGSTAKEGTVSSASNGGKVHSGLAITKDQYDYIQGKMAEAQKAAVASYATAVNGKIDPEKVKDIQASVAKSYSDMIHQHADQVKAAEASGKSNTDIQKAVESIDKAFYENVDAKVSEFGKQFSADNENTKKTTSSKVGKSAKGKTSKSTAKVSNSAEKVAEAENTVTEEATKNIDETAKTIKGTAKTSKNKSSTSKVKKAAELVNQAQEQQIDKAAQSQEEVAKTIATTASDASYITGDFANQWKHAEAMKTALKENVSSGADFTSYDNMSKEINTAFDKALAVRTEKVKTAMASGQSQEDINAAITKANTEYGQDIDNIVKSYGQTSEALSSQIAKTFETRKAADKKYVAKQEETTKAQSESVSSAESEAQNLNKLIHNVGSSVKSGKFTEASASAKEATEAINSISDEGLKLTKYYTQASKMLANSSVNAENLSEQTATLAKSLANTDISDSLNRSSAVSLQNRVNDINKQYQSMILKNNWRNTPVSGNTLGWNDISAKIKAGENSTDLEAQLSRAEAAFRGFSSTVKVEAQNAATSFWNILADPTVSGNGKLDKVAQQWFGAENFDSLGAEYRQMITDALPTEAIEAAAAASDKALPKIIANNDALIKAGQAGLAKAKELGDRPATTPGTNYYKDTSSVYYKGNQNLTAAQSSLYNNMAQKWFGNSSEATMFRFGNLSATDQQNIIKTADMALDTLNKELQSRGMEPAYFDTNDERGAQVLASGLENIAANAGNAKGEVAAVDDAVQKLAAHRSGGEVSKATDNAAVQGASAKKAAEATDSLAQSEQDLANASKNVTQGQQGVASSTANVSNAATQGGTGLRSYTGKLNELAETYKELRSADSGVQKLFDSAYNKDTKGKFNAEDYEKLISDIKQLESSPQTGTKGNTVFSDMSEDLTKLQGQYEGLLKYNSQARSAFNKAFTSNANGKLDTESFDLLSKSLQSFSANSKPALSNFESLQSRVESYRKTLTQYQSVADKETGLIQDGDAKALDNTIAKIDAFDDAVKEMRSGKNAHETPSYEELGNLSELADNADKSVRQLSNSQRELQTTMRTNAGFKTLNNQIDQFIGSNSALLKSNPELNDQFIALKNSVSGFADTNTGTISNLKEMQTNFASLTAQVKGQEGIFARLGARIKASFGERIMFMSVSMFISRLFGSVGQIYTAVQEVDTAMTELKKVTDLTTASYDKFLSKATEGSKQLGVTVSDYINATADFARLGYNLTDSTDLATAATVYKQVGDGIEDIDTASTSIISTMKAFNVEAENSMSVVDAFNEVGNNYAISSTGIGEALGNSASALAAANNDLSESIGLIVAGNDVVQDPSKVGTALKTVSMYLRAAKTDAEDAGESTDGMANSVSELRSELLSLTNNKVDIMLDDTTFKSTYDILKELSVVWNDLADVDQANILELIGGKRNSNVVTSVLNNFKDADAVVKTISGDSGSAMEEQAKWLDSIDGRVAQLKATAQGLANNLLSSDTTKGAIVAITAIVDKLNWVVDHAQAIAAVINLFALPKATSIVAAWSKLGNMIKVSFANLVTTVPNIKNSIVAGLKGTSQTADTTAVNANTQAYNTNTASKEENAAVTANTTAAVGVATTANTQAYNINTAAKEGNTVATTTTTGSAGAAGVATGELTAMTVTNSAAIEANTVAKEGNAVASAALKASIVSIATLVVSAGLVAWQIYSSYQQKIKQKAQETESTFEETAGAVDDYVSRIKELRDKMNSSESEEDKNSARSELLKIENDIYDTYGDQVSAIDLVNGKLDEQLTKVKQIGLADANNYTAANHKEINEAVNNWNDPHVSTDHILESDTSINTIEQILGNHGSAKSHLTGASASTTIRTSGTLKEQKDAIDELYSYSQNHQDEFGDGTLKLIEKVFNKVTEDYTTYSETITRSGKAFFDYQNQDKDITSKYTDYSKAVNDYNEAIANGDYDGAAAAEKIAESMAAWLTDPTHVNNEAARTYIQNMFAETFTVDVQLEMNLHGIWTGKNGGKSELQGYVDALADDNGDLNYQKVMQYGQGTDKDKINAYKKLDEYAKYYGITLEELIHKLNTINDIEVENPIPETETTGSAFADQMAKIDKLSTAMTSLTKIHDDVKNKGTFDFASLTDEDFTESFGKLSSYEDFLKVVSNSPDDIEKCQSAFNRLVREYINSTGVLDTVTEENAAMTTAWLKSMGVANADAIVQQKLNDQKLLGIALGKDYADATYEEVKSAYDSADASDGTKAALARLALTKLKVNKTKITSASDVSNLYDIAKAAGATAAELEGVAKAKAKVDEADKIKNQDKISLGDLQREYYLRTSANDDVQNALDNFDTSTLDPYFTGGDSNNGGSSSSGSSSGSSEDTYLEAWKTSVDKQKNLMEQDKLTKAEYYAWLKKYYKKKGGLADTAAHRKKYADEIVDIENELYDWEKEAIQDEVTTEKAALTKKYNQGLIGEAEYQQELLAIDTKGYEDLKKAIDEDGLYGRDDQERLEAENEMLEQIKDDNNAAFDAELSDLDHLKSMELVTEEQYLIKHAALVKKYYSDEAMYAKELLEQEEKLYQEKTDLVKKWADAAKEAISAITDSAKDTVSAVEDLITGYVDAVKSNYTLQQNRLKHALEMNYITEDEYYSAVESLYKDYFKNKSVYLDEYWQAEEEIYDYEQQKIEDNASAVEDIHGKVVEMIKQELEDQKDAIEETQDAYNDLIDIRRKALEDMRDEDDYETDRTEKLTAIAELQRQLNALSNDTSASGMRKYKEVLAQLVEAQKDLKDLEKDRADTLMDDALDAEEDAYSKKADADTEKIDDQLDDTEWLVSEAWKRMEGMLPELFDQLEDYAAKHSTDIKDNVVEPWETATDAVNNYGGSVKTMYSQLQNMIRNPEDYTSMTDSDYNSDSSITAEKEAWNYYNVAQAFAEDMAGIVGDATTNMAGILNDLFPNIYTELGVDAADIVSTALNGSTGISGELAATAAALGGLSGIMSIIGGGTANKGVAIGGEYINTVLSLLGLINTYTQGVVNGGVGTGGTTGINGITGTWLPLILSAIQSGPVDNSSVIGGLTTLSGLSVAMLTIVTQLLNGGGVEAGTLGTILSTVTTLLGAMAGADTQELSNMSGIASILVAGCNIMAQLFGITSDTSGSLTVIQNLLTGVWSIISSILNYLGSSSLFTGTGSSGLTGILSSLSGMITTALNNTSTASSGNSSMYTLLSDVQSAANKISSSGGQYSTTAIDRILSVINSPNGLLGTIAAAVPKIVTQLETGAVSSNNLSTIVAPVFNINSSDPQGVAAEIEKLFPKIANYTIDTIVSATGNRGVKRKAASLV